jgi:hypothetical protein
MALVVGSLPDLGSPDRVAAFFASNGATLKFVIACVSLGFLFFLIYLGSLIDRLRCVEGSGPLAGTAFAAAVMFMTLFNAAVGLDAAAGLLYETASPDVVYALHTAAFVLAAPAAFVGVAFFCAIALLVFSVGALPRLVGWAALAAIVANACAIGGVFAASGPLNSGNGLLGGIVVPLFAWVLWIALDGYTTLRSSRAERQRVARP